MNSTTKTLEGTALLFNQIELVTPTTVAGTFYGIAFVLFCLYVHALVPRCRADDRKRRAMFMLVYSSVIMLCGLYSLVANTWVAQDAYIKHGSYPGGPALYVLTNYSHAPVITIGLTCQVLVSIMTSAIQIWRVWVVWGATKHRNWIIVLPTMCFLTFTALRLRSLILETALPQAKTVQLETVAAETAEIAFQGAVTLLCTALIALFLMYQHWHQRKLINKSQGSAGYMKVVTMLIESYMLESIWLLLGALLENCSIVTYFFLETQIYIEIIAYLLVQYRVARGTAYESQRSRDNISSLHWNHSNHATTQLEAGSEAGGDHHVSTKPGALDVLQVSTSRAS